jgi:predicted transcriptional regulator
MNVLLSIKPEFANKIFDGTKKYEYRRVVFKNKKVNKIIVYASAPVSKVIGEFDFEKVLQDKPELLWQSTKNDSGITKEYFCKYFNGKETGFAIKVNNTYRYKKPLNLAKAYGLRPPQSFCYLKA